MANKLYRGVRDGHVAKVFADTEELSLEHANKLHPSDSTVEFAYFGSGPSQTALAILLDATGDEARSLKYYQEFKCEFIANADYHLGFIILQSQVQQWMEKRIKMDEDFGKGWVI